MKKKDIWISLAIIACSGLSVLYYTQRKGYVGIDAGGTDAVLRLNSIWPIITMIKSGVKSSAIPVRIYRPKSLNLSMKQYGHTWRISCNGPWGDIATIKVKHNQETSLRLGPPFLIQPKVRKNGAIFCIDFDIIGQAGEHYTNLITKNNRTVTGAKIKILDETGNVLESGKFKYG